NPALRGFDRDIALGREPDAARAWKCQRNPAGIGARGDFEIELQPVLANVIDEIDSGINSAAQNPAEMRHARSPLLMIPAVKVIRIAGSRIETFSSGAFGAAQQSDGKASDGSLAVPDANGLA